MRIGNLTFKYTPQATWGLNNWVSTKLFHIHTAFSLQGVYANIFDEGSLEGDKFEKLVDEKEYSALGGDISVRVRLNASGWDKVELSASHSSYSLSNHVKSSSSLSKVSGTLFLDKALHYGITFDYQEGEDGVLLEKVDKKSISFSVRF